MIERVIFPKGWLYASLMDAQKYVDDPLTDHEVRVLRNILET